MRPSWNPRPSETDHGRVVPASGDPAWHRVTAEPRPEHLVAVVSDGGAVAPSARRYAALIEDLAGLPVRVLGPAGGGEQQDETDLRAFPPEVATIFLQHARPEFACQVRALAGWRPVLTDQDTTAIALAAALLTTLSRAGRAPRASKVVIAGADNLPILCPLLMVCGISDITTWSPADAITFPLRRIAAGAHVVVDLLDVTADLEPLTPHAEPTVLAPDEASDPLLALPGLLRALTDFPGARLDFEVYHDCALALVMATPPDERSPAGPDAALTDRVADAAARALRKLAHRPFDTTIG